MTEEEVAENWAKSAFLWQHSTGCAVRGFLRTPQALGHDSTLRSSIGNISNTAPLVGMHSAQKRPQQRPLLYMYQNLQFNTHFSFEADVRAFQCIDVNRNTNNNNIHNQSVLSTGLPPQE